MNIHMRVMLCILLCDNITISLCTYYTCLYLCACVFSVFIVLIYKCANSLFLFLLLHTYMYICCLQTRELVGLTEKRLLLV